MPTTRERQLRRLQIQADRETDKLTAPLADTARRSIERHMTPDAEGVPQITPLARRQILRDVDAALDAIYGTRRGTDSPMLRLIAGFSERAYRQPVREAIAEMRRRLRREPDVLRALEDA